MRIRCPFCGERDLREFLFHGDAAVTRPKDGGAAVTAEWIDYVYFRENARGVGEGLWYHAAGCHAWLVVRRDNLTHEVFDVRAVRA